MPQTDLVNTILQPEHRVTVVILALLIAALLFLLIWSSAKGKLKWSIFKYIKVEPVGVSTASATTPAAISGGAMQAPTPASRRYSKVLYVKVTYLSDRTKSPAPFYRRTVKRLAEAERAVPVFDEAVYYTLELFPKKGPIAGRKDRSSGVVDGRIVIPWHDDVQLRDMGEGLIKERLTLESDKESDTFLTISHFENGLAGSKQDVGTDVPEDAEYVRLLVDFSSVPNAAQFITADRATLRHKGEEEIVPIAQPSPGLFSAVCNDVKKSSFLKMDFTFDWSRRS